MDRVALLSAAVEGFLLGASLIVAIGAQNAFVLRQGLARRHVFAVASICALSDLVLIAAGVGGLGTLVHEAPSLLTAVSLAGAAFLAVYGLLSFHRALRPEALTPADRSTAGLAATVATCLALTFLNPHVYLDTVVLIGALSGRHPGAGRSPSAPGRDWPRLCGSTAWATAPGWQHPSSPGRKPGRSSIR